MTLSREQFILLLLALIGLGFLVQQTQQPPLQTSLWRGGALSTQRVARQSLSAAFAPQSATEYPSGNPLRNPRTVITQGYGVGSHAPASVWGGIDLAVDGDGDGKADPQGTWRVPVYATHDGVARVRPDTWPGGNYLAIENNRYKTAYAHLDSYAVVDGQPIVRGQLIGYVGSTGMSSGPHLHYEVWEHGINRDPLDFDVLRHEW
ncbi:M23 family metallopeptidase [Roseiflexus castenholzii]|uniref:M23 family metallopeptidase n=1 Tax=Roseiflexus castenholzii TaxID=120962 RepID=UPI003C7C25FD